MAINIIQKYDAKYGNIQFSIALKYKIISTNLLLHVLRPTANVIYRHKNVVKLNYIMTTEQNHYKNNVEVY